MHSRRCDEVADGASERYRSTAGIVGAKPTHDARRMASTDGIVVVDAVVHNDGRRSRALCDGGSTVDAADATDATSSAAAATGSDSGGCGDCSSYIAAVGKIF